MYKHKEQRVGVLVDVSNMYHSAKNLYNARLNFKKIVELGVDKRKLIRSIAYVVRSNTQEEETFFDALDKSGFEVKEKDLQVFAGGMKKGDWDVGLSMDAIKLADRLDAIILVTGDGDYVPLVTYLQENKGCQVEVIGFGKTTSAKLLEVCDDYTNLDEHTKDVLIKKRQARVRPTKSLKKRKYKN